LLYPRKRGSPHIIIACKIFMQSSLWEHWSNRDSVEQGTMRQILEDKIHFLMAETERTQEKFTVVLENRRNASFVALS
jgi:hypothetical protein